MNNSMSDSEKLFYEIHNYSSYATSYLPENILEDSPGNQGSRWSSNTNNPPQFLTLKLHRPAVVEKIKFGKFEKSHVCNLKRFRVYGGLSANRMALLLESGLKNDSIPEVFNLRCLTVDGDKLPILYIKIAPLLSWGPSFNFSIWYVELHGQDDPMFMGSSLKSYNMLREIEIIKLCLKHFRQQGYHSAFKALFEETNVQLEHALISDLHECLVNQGDFVKAEELISECVNEGLMDTYLEQQDYKHSWHLQQAKSVEQPGTRGGHQLVMDTKKRLVYLFGGWDGFQDLSDLWTFDIATSNWTLIYDRCEQFGGPTPRSCHKMIFDPVSENIFMVGRYLENSIRTTEYVKSDFYLYDTRTSTWLQICDDTSQVGGPQLVYDHQMCLDVEKRMIYVFGGKILTPRSVHMGTNEPDYSGLFSYHIATNTWTQILVDCHHPSACQSGVLSIKSRITHCMVFHNRTRKLYIYGGQRGKEDIEEFISYDVDSQVARVLNRQHSIYDNKNEPPAGFTLRATIDCDRDEIYVFSSLSKQKDRREVQQVDSSNSFWVYSLQTNVWSRIYTCRYVPENMQVQDKNSTQLEPCPRFAHQLIYDDVTKKHYLFGGNPGRTLRPQLRLDDFWILVLKKPTRQEVLNHCRYLVRKQYYEEITRLDPHRALRYLQVHIAEVIDHSDPVQLNNFHKLAAYLFKAEEPMPIEEALTTMPIQNQFTTEGREGGEGAESSPKSDDFNEGNAEEEESSMESYDSLSTLSDSTSFLLYRKSGGKKSRQEYTCELRTRRAFLFNKISQLMPSNKVQPRGNLSDFVLT